ncbi:protein ADM2 [Rhinophrynus dorsalis]
MRSWIAVSLSYISLLCVQMLPGSQPLPSAHLLLLPTPREPPDREKQQTKRPLTDLLLLTPPMAEVKRELQFLRRKKRRAHRSHAPKLMRVGCVLGTCQVQNLNYRLWQLMGQLGKEDSPIQLSNPHSYG